MDGGFNDLFGLDSYANILLSLGYAITDNLGVTVGRSRLYKEPSSRPIGSSPTRFT